MYHIPRGYHPDYYSSYGSDAYARALAEEQAARQEYANALRQQEEARQRAARARLAREAYSGVPQGSYLVPSDEEDDFLSGTQYLAPYGYPRQGLPTAYLGSRYPEPKGYGGYGGYGLSLRERATHEEQRRRELEMERAKERERMRRQMEEERQRQMMEEELKKRILEEERRRRELEEQQEMQRKALEEETRGRALEEEIRRHALERERKSREQLRPSGLEGIYVFRPTTHFQPTEQQPSGRARTVSPSYRRPSEQPVPTTAKAQEVPRFPQPAEQVRPTEQPKPVQPPKVTEQPKAAEQPKPAESPKVVPTEAPSFSPEQIEAAKKIQIFFRKYLPRIKALKKLYDLDKRFEGLKSSFTLPHRIDFKPDSHSDTTISVDTQSLSFTPMSSLDEETPSVPPLAYTPNNASLHQYYEELNRILMALDAVESHGDQMVREQRREVARKVEREAERIDRWKVAVWKAWEAQERARYQQGDCVEAAPRPPEKQRFVVPISLPSDKPSDTMSAPEAMEVEPAPAPEATEGKSASPPNKPSAAETMEAELSEPSGEPPAPASNAWPSPVSPAPQVPEREPSVLMETEPLPPSMDVPIDGPAELNPDWVASEKGAPAVEPPPSERPQEPEVPAERPSTVGGILPSSPPESQPSAVHDEDSEISDAESLLRTPVDHTIELPKFSEPGDLPTPAEKEKKDVVPQQQTDRDSLIDRDWRLMNEFVMF